MKDIEPVGTYGPMLDGDVRETLNDLYRGSRYSAKDLYDRYSSLVREEGRNPGHPIALGQALRRFGCTRTTMTLDGGGRGHHGRGKQIVAWIVA